MPDDPMVLKPVPGTDAASPVPKRRRYGVAWLVAVAAMLGLAGYAAWRFLGHEVVLVHARRGTAIEAVYATGTVEPTIMLPIAARITARLVELDVDEGDRVHKGQQLARLEDTDLGSNLAQARSQEAFARAEFDRYAALLPRGVIARSQYDKVRADWLSSHAAAGTAAATLRYARLVAPTAGTVIRRDGEIGQLMTPGDAVFWLAVDSPPRVTADVDEEDIAKVAVGQPVAIHADAFPGEVYDGHVQSVTPKGDATARSYRVRIAIDGATPLQVGMTTEVNIVVRRHDDALLVPDAALDGDRVWVARGDRIHASPVVVGIRGDRQVEIVRGVSPDDAIVAAPTEGLEDGERVRSAPRGTSP